MNRWILLICTYLVSSCQHADLRSTNEPPESIFVQDGRFDPKNGFLGYEGYTIYLNDIEQDDDALFGAILGIRADRPSVPRIDTKPDVVVEAFYLGQEYGGDRYGIWTREGLVAPIGTQNAPITVDQFAAYRVEPNALGRLRQIVKSNAEQVGASDGDGASN